MPLTYQELEQQLRDINCGITAPEAREQWGAYGMPEAYAYEGILQAEEVRNFVAMAAIQPGDSVLDLACGLGWVAMEALGQTGTGRVVAVDCSPDMLKWLRLMVDKLKLSTAVEIIEGDVLSPASLVTLLPSVTFAGFDVIFARQLFGDIHQARQTETLREWARYLAPGGRMVVDQYHEYRYVAGVATVMTDGTGTPGQKTRLAGTRHWEEAGKRFRGQVSAAGLEMVKVERVHYFTPDQSETFTAKAQQQWEKDQRTGKMQDQFVEIRRRR